MWKRKRRGKNKYLGRRLGQGANRRENKEGFFTTEPEDYKEGSGYPGKGG